MMTDPELSRTGQSGRSQDTRMPEEAFVSVIVPTCNRASLLADCLVSLRQQDYAADRFEIIVVDDGSADRTPAVVREFQDRRFPEVRYVRQSRRGPNAARNAGIAMAKGDPICLLDDDVVVPSGWLRELVGGALRHPEAGAVGGPIRVRLEGVPPRFCGREPLVGEGEIDLGAQEREVPEVASGNMAVRTWALAQVGLFDESLPIYGDELEWERRLTRARHPIFYVPTASLWHRRTDLRLQTFLKRYFKRGINYVAFAQRTGEKLLLNLVLRKSVLYLAHAIRRRCAMGLFLMVQQIGVLWGMGKEWMDRQWMKRRSTS